MGRLTAVTATLACVALLAVPFAPGAAPAGAPRDALDVVDDALARLASGDAPASAVRVTVGPDGGLVEEALGAAALTASLAAARRALGDGSVSFVEDGPVEPTPVGRQKKKGLGTTRVPYYSGCAPVRTTLASESPAGEPRSNVLSIVMDGSGRPTGVLGEPEACGHAMRAYKTVYLNATPALETCGSCAQAYAQFWTAAEPVDYTRINTFYFVRHRGDGHFEEVRACWPEKCTTVTTFVGSGATVEFFMTPPDPLPACVQGTITCEGWLEDEFEIHALNAVRKLIGV